MCLSGRQGGAVLHAEVKARLRCRRCCWPGTESTFLRASGSSFQPVGIPLTSGSHECSRAALLLFIKSFLKSPCLTPHACMPKCTASKLVYICCHHYTQAEHQLEALKGNLHFYLNTCIYFSPL